MISLLRKIRKILIPESLQTNPSARLRKYFFYAIGEILLVVIGILIAIQVNNRNEKRKQRAVTKDHLLTVSENIRTDLLVLDSLASFRDSVFIWYNTYLDQKIREDENISLGLKAFSSMFRSISFSPDMHGFESLINSGTMSKEKESTLINSLYVYYDVFKSINEKENRLQVFMENMEQELYLSSEEELDFNNLFRKQPVNEQELNDFYKNASLLLKDRISLAIISRGAGMVSLRKDYRTMIRIGENILTSMNDEYNLSKQ